LGYEKRGTLNRRGTKIHFSNETLNGDVHMATKRSKKLKRRNPVAKFAGKFNHARVHRDKTKYWRRKRWQKIEES
jgi:hypothetical protein